MRREGHIIKNRKFAGFTDVWHDEFFYGLLQEELINKSTEYIEVNDKKFKIIKLLGKGKGGYSY